MTVKIQILRVVGIRARNIRPRVVAIAEGHVVTWDRRGWDCTCSDTGCPHIDVVADLLAPSVTGETEAATP